MDAQLKAKWVEALRSGKYRQGRSTLKHSGSFCCLGVLCDVADIAVDDADVAYPALEKLTGGYGEFVKLNDIDEKTFPEIADFIEVNL